MQRYNEPKNSKILTFSFEEIFQIDSKEAWERSKEERDWAPEIQRAKTLQILPPRELSCFLYYTDFKRILKMEAPRINASMLQQHFGRLVTLVGQVSEVR